MKLRAASCLLAIVVGGSVAWAAPPQHLVAAPLRVLVVTGGHDYPESFYTLFDDPAKLAWNHARSNHEAFRSDVRAKYDVLVLYDSSTEISDAEKKHLMEFAEARKGIVVLHHALTDYPGWEWWWRDVVGGKYLVQPEGTTPASTYLHDQEISIEPVGQHPILAGIGPMQMNDETYKGMWISPKVEVILRTDNPTSDGPVAWISPYKESRVVVILLGHGELAHRHAGYRRLVLNAISWAGYRPSP